MMANVNDCGELYDELWELSDIDEQFAQVPLPDDVIDVPAVDDALLATHSAVESLSCRFTIGRYIAHLLVVQRVVLDVL